MAEKKLEIEKTKQREAVTSFLRSKVKQIEASVS